MLSLIDIIIMLGIGFFAGAIIGLAGASGAVVMISLLYLLLGFSMHKSIGTTLLANLIASSVVSFVYFRNRNVDFRPCIWLMLGAIPGSQIGAMITTKISEIQLRGLFGIILIIMGIYLWRKGFDREDIAKRFGKLFRIRKKYVRMMLGISIGMWVGMIASMFGATGGIWFLMILLLVFGLPLHKSVGSSAFLMSLTALSATLAHAVHGNVNLVGGLIVGIGAAVSGNLSARFANKSTEEILMKVISILIVILGVFMISLEFVGINLH